MADGRRPPPHPPLQPPLPFASQDLYNLVNHLHHNQPNVATWAENGDGFDIHDMDTFKSYWLETHRRRRIAAGLPLARFEQSLEDLWNQHSFRQGTQRVVPPNGLFQEGNLQTVRRICPRDVYSASPPPEEHGSADQDGTGFPFETERGTRSEYERRGLSLPSSPPPAAGIVVAGVQSSETNQFQEISPFRSSSPRDYNRNMRRLDSRPSDMPFVPNLAGPTTPVPLHNNFHQDENNGDENGNQTTGFTNQHAARP